jgi:hypothetical protein
MVAEQSYSKSFTQIAGDGRNPVSLTLSSLLFISVSLKKRTKEGGAGKVLNFLSM